MLLFSYARLLAGDPKAEKKRLAAEKRAAEKAEKEEKQKALREARKKEQEDKKKQKDANRKVSSLANKSLTSLIEVLKQAATVRADASNKLPDDNPQLAAFNDIIAEVGCYKKCASAVLQALAKCNGQPLPQLPFETDKQVNAKIKELREQIDQCNEVVGEAAEGKESQEGQGEQGRMRYSRFWHLMSGQVGSLAEAGMIRWAQ